jgi:RNA polymerase sigma-70 factor (ECF subfamily)
MRTPEGESVEVDRVFREVYGHAVATLVRLFGDISTAEDAVQDAFVVATRRWCRDGIPPNPAGWIVTTARNRAIDQLRRTARGRELSRMMDAPSGPPSETTADAEDAEGTVRDDRLRLIFTCCHPALRTEHQVALTLRLLGGPEHRRDRQRVLGDRTGNGEATRSGEVQDQSRKHPLQGAR